jgi:phosphatidylglycerol lysyltransferase
MMMPAEPVLAQASLFVESDSRHARARELVLAYGWNTTAYQILNPGIQLWFSQRHDAVAGYVHWNRRRIIAGAPVCDPSVFSDVVAELESDAARRGDHVVYFGAEHRLDALHQNSPAHSRILLGAQPTWHPNTWPHIIATHASLRAQLNRARNKNIEVHLWPSSRAERHPALQQCLTEWLTTRHLPPLHFLVEPDTLGNLQDRKVFVASRDNTPVAFLVASPIPARQGWLTEQFVRGANAPNGTAELMIDTAVRWMLDHNAHYVTLGLAPLSTRAPHTEHPTPLWLRALFRWTRAHGRRFYNFDGLDAFKAKFSPEHWEPVYAIANESSFSPHSLFAIASAFTNGAPLQTVVRGLVRAVRQELLWLGR